MEFFLQCSDLMKKECTRGDFNELLPGYIIFFYMGVLDLLTRYLETLGLFYYALSGSIIFGNDTQ